MDQLQCPNCGGYKASSTSRDVTRITPHEKVVEVDYTTRGYRLLGVFLGLIFYGILAGVLQSIGASSLTRVLLQIFGLEGQYLPALTCMWALGFSIAGAFIFPKLVRKIARKDVRTEVRRWETKTVVAIDTYNECQICGYK